MAQTIRTNCDRQRVVVTGMGAVSPYGLGKDLLIDGLTRNQSAISTSTDLRKVDGLRSLVVGRVPDIDAGSISRKYRRAMSPMSIFAALAAGEAIEQARISDTICRSGRMGVAIGSTVGSPIATEEFFSRYLTASSLNGIRSTTFFKMMNHSSAMNLAQLFKITGRVLAPSVACSTGCQTVGLGYEMIAVGLQEIMLCGGTDEFHPIVAGTFDIMNAASFSYNDNPHQTPRPFDISRDGVVCAEGAGVLVLESIASARQRDAVILAEVVGFATTNDTSNIANPSSAAVTECMRQALRDAALASHEIDYINAHATGTLQGDRAEAQAIADLFGDRVPVSGLKGHVGHTMAASGALETIAAIEMMRHNFLVPTLNLDEVDPECSGVWHIRGDKNRSMQYILKNNFALGGVNSSIILKKDKNE